MLNAYKDKTDIVLCFVSEKEIPYDYRDEAQQRRIIAEQFVGQGWRTAELIEEFPHLNFGGLPDPWWLHEGPPCELGFPQETEEHLAQRLAAFKGMIAARAEPRIAVVGHGDFFSRLIGRHLDNCEMAEWDPDVRISVMAR